MSRRKSPQSRLGLRKKLTVYLDPEELRQLESMAQKNTVSSSCVVANLLRDAAAKERNEFRESAANLEGVLLAISTRINKLERIQRTLVLNTAYARGNAVGSLRLADPEARAVLEREIARHVNEQRTFFFTLFPDQKDGDEREAQT